jgi:hypothetical protein
LRTEKDRQQTIASDAGRVALQPGTAQNAAAVELLATRDAALREIRRIQDAETHTMVAFNTNLDVAKRALATRDKPADLAANWRAFLDQPLAGSTVSRAAEQLGSEIDDVIGQAVGAGTNPAEPRIRIVLRRAAVTVQPGRDVPSRPGKVGSAAGRYRRMTRLRIV